MIQFLPYELQIIILAYLGVEEWKMLRLTSPGLKMLVDLESGWSKRMMAVMTENNAFDLSSYLKNSLKMLKTVKVIIPTNVQILAEFGCTLGEFIPYHIKQIIFEDRPELSSVFRLFSAMEKEDFLHVILQRFDKVLFMYSKCPYTSCGLYHKSIISNQQKQLLGESFRFTTPILNYDGSYGSARIFTKTYEEFVSTCLEKNYSPHQIKTYSNVPKSDIHRISGQYTMLKSVHDI